MTPIFDQLLWEYVDREDTTFETSHVQVEVSVSIPHGGTRTFQCHSINIREKEDVLCTESLSIPIRKTPSPAFTTDASSGAASAPVSRSRRSRTTSRRRRPKTFTLSPCLLYTSPSPRDRQKTRMPS